MRSKVVTGSLIAGILLAGCLVGYVVHRIQRSNLLSEAQSYFDQGDYQSTLQTLQPTLAGGGRIADVRILAARCYYRLRQYNQAQEILDPLLRFGEEDARALALSGWIWVKHNSPSQAESRFTKAASLGLEAEAEGGLGAVALLRSENYRSAFLNEAETHLTKSITLDPSNPKVYLVLSHLRRLQHNYPEAVSLAQKAVELAPTWSEPYGMLGQIYLVNGQHAEAEKMFSEGQKYGGSKEDTQYYLAKSVYLQGRMGDALSLLEELIQTGQDRVRDALIDAAKISIVLKDNKSLTYLKRAWSMQPGPFVGMQLYEWYTRENQWQEAQQILQTVLQKWPYLGLAHLEKGHLYLKEMNINRAYSSYQNVLEDDARNFWANYNLGYIAPLRNSELQAPNYFQATLREYEDFFPALVNLVLSHLAVDRVGEANRQLNDLLSRYPDNPYLLLARALERFAAGDSITALQSLQQSLQQEQKQAVPLIIRGDIQLRLFQFEQALTSFESALQIRPQNIRARLGKAHALFRLGDYPQAERIYQDLYSKLSSLPEEHQIEVQNGLALVDMKQGDLDSTDAMWSALSRSSKDLGRQLTAINSGMTEGEIPHASRIEELKIAASSRFALPESFYNLALDLQALDRLDEAIEAYETLLNHYPNYLPGLYNLANLYRQKGRRGDAIVLYDRAHQVAPDRVEIINNQASVYEQMNQRERAKTKLVQAESIDPNYSEVRYNKILLALQEGNKKQAQTWSEQFFATSSYQTLPQMAQALVYASQARWEEAEPLFAEVRKNSPENAYGSLNHGIVLSKLKRFSEAETAMQEAAQRDPSLAVARRALGLLYCQLGLFGQAEEQLNWAHRLDPFQNDLPFIIKKIHRWREGGYSTNP